MTEATWEDTAVNEGKYNRSVKLRCSTCASTDFEYDKEREDGPIRCTSCDRVFSREELIKENGENIDMEVDEVKAEVVADLQRELTSSLRKAFSGSKGIKFR